ncbi:MAG: tyrosine-type recombinase/integrase [Methanomassiliicoccales archaeon]
MSFPENDSAQCGNRPSFNGNAALNISNPDFNSYSEGSNAKRKPGNRKSSVVKRKPGRKRGPRSMGRYPFLAWKNKYLETTEGNFTEATRKEYDRRYRRIHQEMTLLVEKGKMTTTNPEKMTTQDILRFMGHLRSKGVKESERCHDLSALKSLFALVGNPAVEQFKIKYKSMVPTRRQGRFPPIEDTDFETIIKASEKVRDDNWRMLQAYAVVILSICAGLRNKELRLSDVFDLDTNDWIFHARRVKGEDTYGQARDIPIRKEGRKLLVRYLRVRDQMVADRCPDNKALFPALGDKHDGYYVGNSLQKMKVLVEQETGIKFDLRMCRRTFGQLALDEGMSIESVSGFMGHNNTKTTENNYCRRKQELAIKEARKLWDDRKESSLLPSAKSPLIDSKYEVTGYV